MSGDDVAGGDGAADNGAVDNSAADSRPAENSAADGMAAGNNAGGDAILELIGLSVGYDRAIVVRGLNLTVGHGEVVALLGANGAGKTTTLRAISGLLKHPPGTIRFGGTDLAGISPTARARLGIAHVPFDRGIFFGLTVAEHFRLDGLDRKSVV